MISDNKNKENACEQRENFSSKVGFIMACIGSAIGLGNIWMFPWRVGKYGGAAFLVPYFIFVFLLGTIGLMGEFAFGRTMKKGPIGAFKAVFDEKKLPFGSTIGTIPVIGGTAVAIAYAIVVGWIFRYFISAMQGKFYNVNIPEFFGSFAGQSASIPWSLLAVCLTLIILIIGVSKGIERINNYIMPGFFILFIILMIRSVTLEGAKAGIEYLLIPDWSYLVKPITWVMALGQAFFTVSLGGAGMVVYGSYIRDDVDIPSSAFNTALFDTLAAMIAAFVVIPAVFAFNLDPTAGPPLLFITLPMVFKEMPFGHLFSILFFAAIMFAAVSSLINLMEIPVEAVMDKFKIGRKKATIIVAALIFIIGLPLSTNIQLFGQWMDVASIYIVPLGAVLASITFFWIYDIDRAREKINIGAVKPIGKWFEPLAKYMFVIIAVAVLVLGILYGGIG